MVAYNANLILKQIKKAELIFVKSAIKKNEKNSKTSKFEKSCTYNQQVIEVNDLS